MNPFSPKEIASFSETAEIKRLLNVLSNDFLKSTPKCLLVTSALKGEGKTTVVAGLASVVVKHTNLRVLAIDLNWYRPALHACFGLNLNFEIALFREKKNVTDQVQPSGLDRLDILTAPRSELNDARPPEAEDLNLGIEIVKIARENYDLVVIDTAPIFPVNRYMIDPVTVSTTTDGVAITVLTNVTARQQVKRAQVLLATAGANLLGVVTNHWRNPVFKDTQRFSK